MLCVRENQTYRQNRTEADPQFPWHLACTLPAGLRREAEAGASKGKAKGGVSGGWWADPTAFGGQG